MFIIILLLIMKSPTFASPVNLTSITPSQILHMFSSTYPIVVHYENSTSYIVNTLFAKGFQWFVYFVNHDIFRDFRRPNSETILNIVMLNNQYFFLNYSWTDYNVEQEDIVFFIEESISKPNHTLPIWKNHQETIVWTNAFIYVSDENQLYYCCYCCGTKSGMLQRTNITELPLILKKLRICHNFNGRIFKVAYITYKPFFWCRCVNSL